MTDYFEQSIMEKVRADIAQAQADEAIKNLVDLMVRLESLAIKWNKYGHTLTTFDEVLESLEETYK